MGEGENEKLAAAGGGGGAAAADSAVGAGVGRIRTRLERTRRRGAVALGFRRGRRRACVQHPDVRAVRLSCINPDFTGLPHRFAYRLISSWYEPKNVDIPSFDRVLNTTWKRDRAGSIVSGKDARVEHVFVPPPPPPGGGDGDRFAVSEEEAKIGGEEEDGYLLVMVHVLDEEQPRTELIVLGNGEGGGGLEKVATVHIPIRVPFGFHNEWVPGGAALRDWSA